MAVIELKEQAVGIVQDICFTNGCKFATDEGCRVRTHIQVIEDLGEGDGCENAAIGNPCDLKTGKMTTDGFIEDQGEITLQRLEILEEVNNIR